MAIDATGYEPLDFIWRDYYKWVGTVFGVIDGNLQPLIRNLKMVIDRPMGEMRFGDILITPNYSHRVILAYRYKHPATGETLTLTADLIREGDIIEAEYDGRPIQLYIIRRYQPADAKTYLTLECRLREEGEVQYLPTG